MNEQENNRVKQLLIESNDPKDYLNELEKILRILKFNDKAILEIRNQFSDNEDKKLENERDLEKIQTLTHRKTELEDINKLLQKELNDIKIEKENKKLKCKKVKEDYQETKKKFE